MAAVTSHISASSAKASRVAPTCLIVAALLFGAAWWFMPVAGVTDAREILRIVTPQRAEVLAAAILQLVAATLYVPAMIAIIRDTDAPLHAKLWRPAAVLVVGTLGLATDAVDHLLSYAMTEPGVDQAAQVQAMEWMQGPGLVLIFPLIACYFAGATWLSVAYAKAGAISRWNPALYVIALVVGAGGAALAASTDVIDSRTVGLITLWLVAAAQVWLGLAMSQPRR